MKTLLALALAFAVPACSNSSTSTSVSSEAGSGEAGSSEAGVPAHCGTSAARSKCESITWPRLIIALGDQEARAFVYSATSDNGFSGPAGPCPGGYGESPTIHCDLGFFAGDKDTSFTLHVQASDGGPDVITRQIALTPFNYCGIGAAYLIATEGDAGTLNLSDVRYVDVCGL